MYREGALLERAPEHPQEETDSRMIERRFRELRSEGVELLATNLARPDGFAKTLILGSILTSEELRLRFGADFVKTHRGFYREHPSARQNQGGFDYNTYISLAGGLPQRAYQESYPNRWTDPAWRKGLGFITQAEKLLAQENAKPSWGIPALNEAIDAISNTARFEQRFQRYTNRTPHEYQQLLEQPTKDDFLDQLHIARKAEFLTEHGDQAEVNIVPTEGILPRLPLDQTVILVPEKSEEALRRYLQRKIGELKPFAEELKNSYGVDIAELTPEVILSRYPNIYWYPQDNIGLAVEYLSAHKEKLDELLPEQNLRP